MNEETKLQEGPKLSNSERQEKLILEFSYLKHQLINADKEEQNPKDLKKMLNDIEKDLEDLFGVKITAKNKKDYINFKKASLDKSMLRYAKYMK